MEPKVNPSLSSWTYFSSDKSIQNYSILNFTSKTPHGNVSLGFGTDINIKPDGTTTENVTAQVKAIQNLYKNGKFSLYTGERGRFTPDYTHLRGIFGESYKVNDWLTIYEENYGSLKLKDGEVNPTLSICFGAKAKVFKNIDIGLEGQGNYNPVNSSFTTSANAGLTWYF